MGNRAIQLPIDYKPNFEFPNMIVMLNDDTPTFGQKTSVIQNLGYFNIDQTPVLYNSITGEVISVQEEVVNIPITCTINCESQFQAKELAAIIRKWLPINKFIQFLQFTSFLEVSLKYLDDNHFNPAIQHINNLYTKLNKRTGEIDHCFSLCYKPFIQLNSISTSIPDSAQRSFQTITDLTYMIQRPLSIFNEKQPKLIEKLTISITPTAGFETINDYPSSHIINNLSLDVKELEKGFVRRIFIHPDDNSVEKEVILDQVIINKNEISKTSANGMSVTKGVTDHFHISLKNNPNQYKIKIDSVPVNFYIDSNYKLDLAPDLADNIIISLLEIFQTITIQFNTSDFLITEDYSYNLIKEKTIYKDYKNYILDSQNNSITFNFNNSQFLIFKPILTNPLIVQFYLKNIKFPFQIGGIQPNFGLVRVLNNTSNSVTITWISDVKTTSLVEYSKDTTDYNLLSKYNSQYTYDHMVILENLNNGDYHFRINSEDENGKNYLSQDYTFTKS